MTYQQQITNSSLHVFHFIFQARVCIEIIYIHESYTDFLAGFHMCTYLTIYLIFNYSNLQYASGGEIIHIQLHASMNFNFSKTPSSVILSNITTQIKVSILRLINKQEFDDFSLAILLPRVYSHFKLELCK